MTKSIQKLIFKSNLCDFDKGKLLAKIDKEIDKAYKDGLYENKCVKCKEKDMICLCAKCFFNK